MAGDYSFDEERRSVRINFLGSLSGASVEDYEEAMAKVIDVLLEVKKAERIVLAKEREYEYAGEQAQMLTEVANVLEGVLRERVVSAKSLGGESCRFYYPTWNARLQYIVFQLLRKDPIGAYVEVVRELRDARLRIKNATTSKEAACFTAYKENVLDTLRLRLEQTQLIKAVKPSLAGYHIGDRALYRQLFMPAVRPNFMFTRYMVAPPEGGISVDRYKVGDIDVEVFKMPHAAEYFYHVTPPEFKLSDARYSVLDQSRVYMATHQPKSAEFVRSGKVREMFVAIGRDMIREMAERKAVKLTPAEVEQLAGILARYTAGLGVLEILLADERIQDVYVNSPIEQQPIRVFHADWEECKTNLIPTHEDAEAWATRLRILSGRPLDEANPVLDTDILVPGGSARFAVITKTLSPLGLGFAIRRHRDKPWTLPLFIKSKMLNPLAAGLLSFLIDGTVSILVAGGRGAGKTSVLSGLMLEILPKTRIVTIEYSVTGDCELVYEKGGRLHRGEIGKVVDAMVAAHGGSYFGRDVAPNPEAIRVFSMDREGKVRLSPVSKFIRHKVEKPIYEVETRSGRRIRVTGDHSLFTLGEDGRIADVKTGDLAKGSFLAVPRQLEFSGGIESIDLIENLGKMQGAYVFGPSVKAAVRHSWETVKRVGKELGRPKPSVQWWRNRGILPADAFIRLREEGVAFEKSGLMVRFKAGSKSLPAVLPLDRDFLTLMGLWLADGSYDVNSVIVSVQEEGARDVVKRFAERYGLGWKMHSDGFSLLIHS
ncbi:MAG TPA: ATPase, T2SS/T4P/T4SS family, partial [archaeon]|nr:ATPase, T2SS/T4P/T4SS family [archaeon]